MEVLFYIFIILVSLISLFLLIEQPYIIGSLLVFMMIYQLNVETPLPLDVRGILTVLLFIRLYFFDKENLFYTNKHLLTSFYFWLFVFFTLILILNPIINTEKIFPQLKAVILSLVNLFIGFILVKEKSGRESILFGVILAALFSSFDLIFTFFTTGSLHIIKLIDLIMGRQSELLNHNYPGFLASMGLLIIYVLWYKTKLNKLILSIIGAIFSLGVIISTSRSSILALILVLLLSTIYEVQLKHNLKKIVPAIALLVVFLVGFFFTYNLFLANNFKGSYIDKIYYRLYEEPYKMITGKASDFDKYSGQRIKGSMTFRAERWQKDFEKFTQLDLFKQVFGLGPKGYLEIAQKVYRQSGYLRTQLSSHNGYLLILLERGILGLSLFILLITLLVYNSFKVYNSQKLTFLMAYLLLMLLVYSFAQNAELTSSFAFLFIGTVIGNLKYLILAKDYSNPSQITSVKSNV